jgi:hypothetical protein
MASFDHPMFKPLAVRVILVAVCFVWAGVEVFVLHSFLWAAIFAAAGAYAGYHLLYRYPSGANSR